MTINITTTNEFADSPLLADAHGCRCEALDFVITHNGEDYGVYFSITGDTWIGRLDDFRKAHDAALEAFETGAELADAYQAMHDAWDATESDLSADDLEHAMRLYYDEAVRILSVFTGDVIREATEEEVERYLTDVRDNNPRNGAVSGEPYGLDESVWLDVSNIPETFDAIRRAC